MGRNPDITRFKRKSSMSQTSQNLSYNSNPIDCVEDVLNDNNWVYDRMNNEELFLDVAGTVFTYRLCFVWKEHLDALQILCHYDCGINPVNMDMASETLMEINRLTWMGHFEISSETASPRFRYTCLFRDRNGESVYADIQDIVDICFAQCERYQSVFQILSAEKRADSQVVSLAMMDTAGES